MDFDFHTQQALRSFYFLPTDTLDDLGAWLEDNDDDVLDQAESLGFILEQIDDTVRDHALSYLGANTTESVKELIDARQHAIFNVETDQGSPASAANETLSTYLEEQFQPQSPDLDIDIAYDQVIDAIQDQYHDELGLLTTLHEQRYDTELEPTKLDGISRLKQWDYQDRDPDRVQEEFDMEKLGTELETMIQSYARTQLETFKTDQMEQLYHDLTSHDDTPSIEDYKLLKAYRKNAITLQQGIPDAMGDLRTKHEQAQETIQRVLEHGDAIYEHSPNDQWLEKHGLRPADIQEGIGEQTFTTETGTITVETARPKATVHMGDVFNSCFSINQSGPTKLPPYMADANKAAIYARNENDAIIGRLSIAATEDNEIIVPNYYAHGDHDRTAIRTAMEDYTQQLAEEWEMDYEGLTEAGTDQVKDLVAGYWEPT